jgi:hypothetical protein
MDISWKDVGKKIAQFGATLLGGALAGPVGAEALGGMVADALGTEATPKAVLEKISHDQEAIQKLRQIEAQHKERILEIRLAAVKHQIEQDTARIAEVNRTMRVESKSEHWPQYSWRPYWGFASGTAFVFLVAFCCYLAYLAIKSLNPAAMGMIPTLIASFTGLFGIAGAVLGITAWGRNKYKLAQAGKEGPNADVT